MSDVCAADVHGTDRRCKNRARYPAAGVESTLLIPAPLPEQVCFWHRRDLVPARRPDPAACPTCGKPW